MNQEILIAKEAGLLVRRDPGKYLKIILGIYLLSFFNEAHADTFRRGYSFVRHIDDVLDGDRYVSSDPLSYVEDLRHQVETHNFQKRGIGILAESALEKLDRIKKPSDDPTSDFLRAIDGMIFDYKRTKERTVLTEAELEDYYMRAFDPVVNLGLMGLHPSLRSSDVPALSYSQGRVYTVRDLRSDWVKGIINIPKETMEKTLLTPSSGVEEIEASSEVKKWFHQVFSSSKPELLELQKQLKIIGGPVNFIFGIGLTRSMLGFIDKYQNS